jgi:2-oxoglutarate ferredoxin oxidoreductase subunit alpha
MSPGDCFHSVLEAFTLAVKYMTPVVILSDGYLANGTEPWLIPDVESLPRHLADHRTEIEGFQPYARDPNTLARPWAIPGTPGLEHRIGGLSKANITGEVSYDPDNNEQMIRLRAAKVARIASEIPPLEVDGPEQGKLLVVGWGRTYGAITSAVQEAREAGSMVSSIHLRHLNPFPSNLGQVLNRFEQILVPELNQGELLQLLRSEFLVPAEGMNKLRGQPFLVEELRARIEKMLGGEK